ncbi:hypothetical protein L0244_30455, partial [bacterium]|nr:hypothetical protein [bacterium]
MKLLIWAGIALIAYEAYKKRYAIFGQAMYPSIPHRIIRENWPGATVKCPAGYAPNRGGKCVP